MIDLRRVAIIFVIAILYAIFVNAFVDAFYPAPKYEEYCKQKFYPEKPYSNPADRATVRCPNYKEPLQAELDKCSEDKGHPEYKYDANGCAIEYKGCNFCQREFDNANQKYNFTFFIISSIMAVIGISIGLFLPIRNSLNQWIATGFMLGGLITLFFGTFRYYQYLGRYVKPIVIFLELAIVLYLSYAKLRDINPKNRQKRKKK